MEQVRGRTVEQVKGTEDQARNQVRVDLACGLLIY